MRERNAAKRLPTGSGKKRSGFRRNTFRAARRGFWLWFTLRQGGGGVWKVMGSTRRTMTERAQGTAFLGERREGRTASPETAHRERREFAREGWRSQAGWTERAHIKSIMMTRFYDTLVLLDLLMVCFSNILVLLQEPRLDQPYSRGMSPSFAEWMAFAVSFPVLSAIANERDEVLWAMQSLLQAPFPNTRSEKPMLTAPRIFRWVVPSLTVTCCHFQATFSKTQNDKRELDF